MIGRINFDRNPAGKRSAGKPPATFDEAGTGNVAWLRYGGTRRRKGEQQRTQTSTYTGASVLDPTDGDRAAHAVDVENDIARIGIRDVVACRRTGYVLRGRQADAGDRRARDGPAGALEELPPSDPAAHDTLREILDATHP